MFHHSITPVQMSEIIDTTKSNCKKCKMTNEIEKDSRILE